MFDIELEGLPSEQEMKKWPLSAKKMALEFIKLKVLSQIVTIEPRIHRIRFSGDYDYDQIKAKIGNLKIISTKDKFFKTIAKGKFNGIELRIGLYPRPPIRSDYFRCMIYKTFNSHDSLLKFKNTFPNLKMSKVEYVIDLKCRDSNSTGNLFDLLSL